MAAEETELDVVDLLLAQHDRIRVLFREVEVSGDGTRKERFDELRAFLAVHETAEEMIVHPLAKRQSDEGETVARDRLAEERESKELLARLDDMDVTDPEFRVRFAMLHEMVLHHAGNEERKEFPLLRRHVEPDELRRMAGAVRAAEKIAPTRPHPGVESPAAHLVTGPLASLVDRTRDAVRSALRD